MKGQMGLMEYVFLAFFIILIIVALFFFLSGFQITQLDLQRKRSDIDRALFLTKHVSTSKFLTKEEGVFDDGKLTALSSRLSACQEIEKLLGPEWFFEVRVLDGSSGEILCDEQNYGIGSICNYWSFCKDPSKNSVGFDLPVNVYRNAASQVSTGILPRTDIAVLKVGVYVL